MNKAKNSVFIFVLLGIFFLVMTLLAYYSEGTIESGDSYQHYIMARYAFQHPYLFLDLWAKPFFTLLAAPFAQLGFFGINVFNILCATLTGYFAYLIARKLEIKLPVFAVFFALFAPVYLVTLISGLTEPLFGLVITLSIYLVMCDKSIAGAFLVSFLPLVRSEGNGLLALFLLAFILRRQWKAIPFLAAGNVIYSIIGYFYFKDILWIWHLNPYQGESIYGKGDLFHFVKHYYELLGVPLTIFFIIGCISLLVMLVRARKKPLHPYFTEEFVLLAGAFILYIAGHSYVHWKGVAGSSGTLRPLAAIMPVGGLVALRGFNEVFARANHHPVVTYPLAVIFTLWVVKIPFGIHEFPRKPWTEEVPLARCVDWINEHGLDKERAYYIYPYLTYKLDRDPYNPLQVGSLTWVGKDTPKGSLVIWDSHFGPEANIPLDSIRKDTTLEELKTFISSDPVYTKPDGSPGYFEVHLFRKR